jgi:pimeloyl-ACP methyl ester carboxylesterase
MMYVHQAGPEAAPVILFLHGSPVSSRMWQPQVERLSGAFRCLAPDLPGHGKSAALPFDMDEVVAELAGLVAGSSATGRAHVVGLSFGGVVAQALMSARPEAVERAVLSGTAATLGAGMMAFLRLQVRANGPIVSRMSPEALAGLLGRQFGVPDAYRPMLAEDVRLASPAVYSDAILTTYSDIRTPAASAPPTLVVVGEKETGTARSMARRLATVIPGALGMTAPGGHLWNLQHPDLFSDMVRAWAEQTPLPGALRPF